MVHQERPPLDRQATTMQANSLSSFRRDEVSAIYANKEMIKMSDESNSKPKLTQKQLVYSFFDKNSAWQGEAYDALNDYQSCLLRRRRDYAVEMLKQIPNLKSVKALDIGSGSGAYLEKLLDMGFEVTGVDISEGMLDASRRRLGVNSERSTRVHLKLGEIESLPVPDAEFDLVICIGVVGYLFQDDRALSEIRRVLKPGGCLLLYVSNICSLSNIDFLFRQKVRSFFKSKPGKDDSISLPDYAVELKWAKEHEKYFYKAYNPWKYERVLAGQGLKRINAMTFGFEFRRLRRYHLVPTKLLDTVEILLERLIHRFNIPYLSYSGWMYLGAFTKM